VVIVTIAILVANALAVNALVVNALKVAVATKKNVAHVTTHLWMPTASK
jgi:hypothetical protein